MLLTWGFDLLVVATLAAICRTSQIPFAYSQTHVFHAEIGEAPVRQWLVVFTAVILGFSRRSVD
jgi:hypothetical protein